MNKGDAGRKLTPGRIIQRYPAVMAVTWGLLLLESGLAVTFPLVIGLALDSLASNRLDGLFWLGGLCAAVLVAGSGRRFLDTRAYARIYLDLASGLAAKSRSKKTDLSRTSARISLLEEVISYFEEDLPAFLDSIIGLAGVLVMLWLVDLHLALCAAAASLGILIVYLLAARPIWRLNRGHNSELEHQLRTLRADRPEPFKSHFQRLMRWRIRLSDLETANFSIVWLILSILILASLWLVAGNDDLSLGNKVGAIMYIFQYTEAVMAFPLLYQQFIRVREITGRLDAI